MSNDSVEPPNENEEHWKPIVEQRLRAFLDFRHWVADPNNRISVSLQKRIYMAGQRVLKDSDDTIITFAGWLSTDFKEVRPTAVWAEALKQAIHAMREVCINHYPLVPTPPTLEGLGEGRGR